jgi:hypothetical protein
MAGVGGAGLTVIVYVEAVPLHPDKVGVIVIVAVAGLVPGFAAVKEGTLPVPLAASPIAVLELVHAKLAPAGELVKAFEAIASPSQTVLFVSAVTTGLGFTVTEVVPARLVHPPTVTVTL